MAPYGCAYRRDIKAHRPPPKTIDAQTSTRDLSGRES